MSAHTPGALRAASNILAGVAHAIGERLTDNVSQVLVPKWAEIIDRETGARELLEALKDARYKLYGTGGGNPDMDAAIAKAEGRP